METSRLTGFPQIVHKDFPPPVVLPPRASASASSRRLDYVGPADGASSIHGSSQRSTATDKENDPPEFSRARPPDPSNAASVSDTQDPPSTQLHNGTLPEAYINILDSIRRALTTNFATGPPHTIQRLAELLLRPRSYYRFVGPYLHALDRIVSVSSTADAFPLTGLHSTGNAGAAGGGGGGSGDSGAILPNGTSNITPSSAAASTNAWTLLGSDESLGGARLTPIPWLTSAHQDQPSEGEECQDTEQSSANPTPASTASGGGGGGSNSSSSGGQNSGTATPAQQADMLREYGAVTQGELLRHEQEAGLVSSPDALGRRGARPHSLSGADEGGGGGGGDGAAAAASSGSEDDEGEHQQPPPPPPHASGPSEVGVEDMGPQGPEGATAIAAGAARGRFDVDAALGRRAAHHAHDEDEDERGGSEGRSIATESEDVAVRMGVVEQRGNVEMKDEDVVLTDADSEEGDENANVGREGIGVQAVGAAVR